MRAKRRRRVGLGSVRVRLGEGLEERDDERGPLVAVVGQRKREKEEVSGLGRLALAGLYASSWANWPEGEKSARDNRNMLEITETRV